jgi:hypothetical protein
MHPSASWWLSAAFVVIAGVVAVLFAVGNVVASQRLAENAGARRRVAAMSVAGVLAWMAATGGAAASGLLARSDVRPPPMAFVFVAMFAVAFGVALSRPGARLARGLPLAALVAAQAFRLPLELAMHEAARQGIMPNRMSFTGANFDIVTGALAIPVAIAIARHENARWLVALWNALGALLLANVLVNAFLATPFVHAFGTDPRDVNTFVAYFPFVWLPTVCVAAAIVGHVVVARRLVFDARARGELKSAARHRTG